MARKRGSTGYGEGGGGDRTIIAGVVQESGDAEKDGKIWLTRVAKTRMWRQERRNGERDWRRYYKWFEGLQWEDRGQLTGTLSSENARDTATVNLTGSISLNMIPYIINGDIKFRLKARRREDVESSKLQQSILNYSWKEGGMTRQVKRCAYDTVIIGHGVGKTGYTLEVDKSRAKSDGEISYDDFIRKDEPFFRRLDPLYFYFDPSARDCDLHTARWTAEVWFAPLADVLANDKYSKKAIAAIRSGEWSPVPRANFDGVGTEWPKWARGFQAQLPEDSLIALVEIWDKKFKQRILYADGVPVPLLAEPWPYDYLDNFPYVMFHWIQIPNEPYPIGLARWCEDQQIQLNRSRTNQINHIRAHQRKFGALSGAITKTEVDKFTDGGDGTVVFWDRPEALQPIPDAPISVDHDKLEGRIVNDIVQMTGADALQLGQPLQDRTTAGEVGTRAGIFKFKLADRVDAFAESVLEVATQVLHHLKANKSVSDVVRIEGQEGDEWKDYTPEEIRADVDVTVESFSAPSEDANVERQQWLQILQIVTQALPVLQQMGLNIIDFPKLLMIVLEKFGQKEVSEFILPPAPPQIPGAPPEGGGVAVPPAVAGASAPSQIPQAPGAGGGQIPPEVAALLQQIMGGQGNSNTGRPV